ncbi:hypothetical protein ATZ36_08565 [Candidatus Endomicrobiellum trichonymphae]|uniref:Schlafen AlbA-2 domain-containing protein n=1 Tax=Endomicrobium trichonymphae TaxID=1408204 RepID=A0A1E5IHG4_ENDTX|nr:hypothetical protein ATZ36_08565 [Candidatus Endomicrobium trichonymphae]
MNKKINQLLSRGERSNIEFKECARGISSTVYETVCAFLNAKGGDISLGVKDNGNIIGIAKEHIASIKHDFVTSVNNPSKLSPTACLSPEEIFIDGKKFYILLCRKVLRFTGVLQRYLYAMTARI